MSLGRIDACALVGLQIWCAGCRLPVEGGGLVDRVIVDDDDLYPRVGVIADQVEGLEHRRRRVEGGHRTLTSGSFGAVARLIEAPVRATGTIGASSPARPCEFLGKWAQGPCEAGDVDRANSLPRASAEPSSS